MKQPPLSGKKVFGRGRETLWRRLHLIPGIPVFILAVIAFATIFGSYITPYGPNVGNLYNQFIPPCWMEGGSTEHLLGTDYFGRDMLSRLIVGARISLSVSLITVSIAGTLGTLLGLISGYAGGKTDTVIMRVVDSWLAFPIILLAILFAVVFRASYSSVIIILVLCVWPRYTRLVRGEALAIKEQDYVALARVAGASPFRIMLKHIFPNVLPTVLVLVTFQIAEVIMLESLLSFLGVGIPPPTASWGSMTADGRDYIATLWWLSAIPGLAIFLTVLSTNLLGDWIRDRLDPKLRVV